MNVHKGWICWLQALILGKSWSLHQLAQGRMQMLPQHNDSPASLC